MSEDRYWVVSRPGDDTGWLFPFEEYQEAVIKFWGLLNEHGLASLQTARRVGEVRQIKEPLEDIVDHVRYIEFETGDDDTFNPIGIVIGVIGSAMFWFTLILLGKASAEGWFNGW